MVVRSLNTEVYLVRYWSFLTIQQPTLVYISMVIMLSDCFNQTRSCIPSPAHTHTHTHTHTRTHTTHTCTHTTHTHTHTHKQTHTHTNNTHKHTPTAHTFYKMQIRNYMKSTACINYITRYNLQCKC